MFSLQVPQQLLGSNNCGFHIFMFADHFFKVQYSTAVHGVKVILYDNQKEEASTGISF